MGWPEKLVLVRHAESLGNIKTSAERALLNMATHEYSLTEKGRQQAQITGQYLQQKFGMFDVNYVSYYQRSIETMKLLYPNVSMYEDPRLAEGQRGIWHVMTEDEIQKQFPYEIVRRKREDLYHFRPWGGENWPDIELRIHSFLGTLNRDYEGLKVLIVVHGHWLILFQRLVLHFSIEEALRRYHNQVAANASVTIFENEIIAGKPRLTLREDNLIPWQDQIT